MYKKFLLVGIFVALFAGCSNRSLSFENPIHNNILSDELSFNSNIDYYLEFNYNKGIEAPIINAEVFCKSNKSMLTDNKYSSLAYLNVIKGDAQINTKSPIWVYECLNSSSKELLIKEKLTDRIVFKNGDDIQANFIYKNSHEDSVNENVEKLVNILVSASGSKTAVTIAELALSDSSKKIVDNYNSGSNHSYTPSINIRNNTDKIVLPIYAKIDSKKGLFLNLDLEIKLLPTLLKSGYRMLNGYPQFNKLDNISISRLIKHNYFRPLGDEKLSNNSGDNISNKISDFSEIQLGMFISELEKLNNLLLEKKINKVDRTLILYMAFRRSVLFDSIETLLDNNSSCTSAGVFNQANEYLNLMKHKNNPLFQNEDLLISMNLNEFKNKKNRLEDLIGSCQRISDYRDIINRNYSNFENTFNSFRSNIPNKSLFGTNSEIKSFGTNKMLSYNEFKDSYSNFISGGLEFHGCYLELLRGVNKPVLSINEYISSQYLTIQEILVPSLDDLYSHMILQYNKNSDEKRILFFNGEVNHGQFKINKLLEIPISSDLKYRLRQVLNKNASEGCRTSLDTFLEDNTLTNISSQR